MTDIPARNEGRTNFVNPRHELPQQHSKAAALAPLVGLAVACFLLGLAFGPVRGPAMIVVLAPLSLALFCSVRLIKSLRQTGAPLHVAGLLISVGTLFAVTIPANQLARDERVSVLTRLGVHAPFVTDSVPAAETIFTVALFAFVVGEVLGGGIGMRRRPSRRDGFGGSQGTVLEKRTFWLLLCLGLLFLILGKSGSLAQTFAERGQQRGTGFFSVIASGVPLAASLSFIKHHWSERRYLLASLLGLGIYVALSGTRTPLVLVGTSAVLALIVRTRGRHVLRLLITLVLIGYVASVLIVTLAQWRHSVEVGEHVSFPALVGSVAANPFGQLSSNGQLDTFDGLILAINTSPEAVGAHWTDPSKAVLNLVPYQLWPSKPNWLSATVSHTYTDFGGNAGIFLSGPGYAWIVYDRLIGVVVLFVLLGFCAARGAVRLRNDGLPLALLTYFCLRFSFAGDAFDLFEVTEFLGLYGLVRALAGISIWYFSPYIGPSRPRGYRNAPGSLPSYPFRSQRVRRNRQWSQQAGQGYGTRSLHAQR